MSTHRFTVWMRGSPTAPHRTFDVFVNGAHAGSLTMRTDEAEAFALMLAEHTPPTTSVADLDMRDQHGSQR